MIREKCDFYNYKEKTFKEIEVDQYFNVYPCCFYYLKHKEALIDENDPYLKINTSLKKNTLENIIKSFKQIYNESNWNNYEKCPSLCRECLGVNKHMYNYKEIKVVHLEPTTKCNASCSQCLRSANGGEINPYLPITELSLRDVKNIFPVSFVKQLKRMYMCGNYGDPIVARDCLEIYRYFKKNNQNITLNMNTNGSARDEKWWIELAQVINGRGNVKFGIDGLADTHQIYRQGTDWHKIIRNAKAFISAGGNAIWEYIVFEHNEHQVKEAEKLSRKLGFKEFTVKKTWRFYSNRKNKGKKEHIGIGRDGKKKVFKKPKNEKYINPALKNEMYIKEKFGSMDSYLDQVSISCKVKSEKNVYVSAEGLVFPCCWIANQLYIWYLPKDSSDVFKYIEKCGGLEKMSAKKNSIQTIVNGEFFQKFLSWSWKQESVKNGKLGVCAKICGNEFDPFKAQYK